MNSPGCVNCEPGSLLHPLGGDSHEHRRQNVAARGLREMRVLLLEVLHDLALVTRVDLEDRRVHARITLALRENGAAI
jgi:hypothetical protein